MISGGSTCKSNWLYAEVKIYLFFFLFTEIFVFEQKISVNQCICNDAETRKGCQEIDTPYNIPTYYDILADTFYTFHTPNLHINRPTRILNEEQ